MIDKEFVDIIRGNTGCAVIMAGSDSDKPHIERIADSLGEFDVPYRVRIMSAHKQPTELENAITEYNDIGGSVTYVAIAGGTDALSGTLSFHALGLVISCPPDTRYADKEKHTQEFNETCLRNPPGSSNCYVARPDNVGKLVAQIYAGVNLEFRHTLTTKNEEKIAKLQKADQEFTW